MLAPEAQVRILNKTLKWSGHALETSVSTGALGSAQESFLLVDYFQCAYLSFDKTV